MASKNDPFQFQEFDEAGTLLESNRDAVTISIDDEDLKSKKQRSAVGFAQDVGDEEPLINEDREELLSGQKKNAPFWTFEYYQKFFDIETHHVKERILGSLVPWPGKNFIQVHLRKNPDLYGPFWICTTLVFAIAISGNLSTFLRYFGNSNYKYTAEFGKVSIAATAIFSYAWLVPLGLWGLLLWRSNKILNLVSYSFMEIVCVYGYSLAVYIPAVVLWIPHVEWLRWLSIVVALCLSSSVLVMTFWPALRDDHPKVIIATVAGIVLLNGLLAVGCKMYFFSEPKLGPGHVSPPAAKITNGTSS
ncbi:protein YIPF1 [Poecilia reticulata]|uniref:protein YIPF1 n=1 Tax=Poecilia reticulata TaxID=8081 RepID=UPI0004A4D764|nr:PREDICTED: protein YIPF1 [Poecilia reticulata]XP_008432609.1 PREDICTED: protein YIPF1 [Poecilia reticulata]